MKIPSARIHMNPQVGRTLRTPKALARSKTKGSQLIHCRECAMLPASILSAFAWGNLETVIRGTVIYTESTHDQAF